MAIAILVGRDEEDRHRHDWFIKAWRDALLAIDSSLDIRIWPDIGNDTDIDVALVWKHPLGALKTLRSLKVIFSLAAGVDHILVDNDLNPAIPITRLVDHYMAKDIMQYVVGSVLHYVRRFDYWHQKQEEHLWQREPPFTFADEPVGVMGLGFLGGRAAKALLDVGLQVRAWRNTHLAHDERIECFVGKEQLAAFLTGTRVLVCMLPLTPTTSGLLSRAVFSQLPKGAYIINVGRGEHVVEKDLLEALETGQLSGATLDVFPEEPLPFTHAFWNHPKILVTPHVASVTNPVTAAPQVYENYRRVLAGQELTNRVSLVNLY